MPCRLLMESDWARRQRLAEERLVRLRALGVPSADDVIAGVREAPRGDVCALRDLLDRGGDVSGSDTRGWAPLHWAAALGHSSAAALLLDRKARIDVHDKARELPQCCHHGARYRSPDATPLFPRSICRTDAHLCTLRRRKGRSTPRDFSSTVVHAPAPARRGDFRRCTRPFGGGTKTSSTCCWSAARTLTQAATYVWPQLAGTRSRRRNHHHSSPTTRP